jgi:hypothetical protein
MTLIDVTFALIIFALFFFGFSQAFLPAYNAWDIASKEYRTAHTIYFVSESFKQECAKQDRNMDNWERAVKVAKELESYQITELMKEDVLFALKLICTISGEPLEIIGVCIP